MSTDENGTKIPVDKSSIQHYNWDDIPNFRSHNLPEGEWFTSWEKFVNRFGTNPPRRRLIEGLRQAIHILREAGCQVIYIDGSFVTDKAAPGDIDCCWERTSAAQRRLDQLNPTLLNLTMEGRTRQKHVFGCEFFPHDRVEGISGTLFLEFFKRDRRGRPKGIIKLETKDVP